MRHGTNFIFSNRDLRSPQASAPPSSACPEMHCSGLLFSSREYFSPPLSSPSRFSSASRSWHSDISSVAPRKHKKRYLYESVFFPLFCGDSSSRFVPSPPSNFSPMFFFEHVWFRGGRSIPPRQGIETRVESDSLSGHSRQTTHSHSHMHVRAHVYNEQPLALLQIPRTFDESRMPIRSRLCQ